MDAVVERCTSDMLFQPDYEQNLAVVDTLNDRPKLIETYLNAIKRRMANPAEEIVLTLCVNLLETILKNVPGAVEIWGKTEYQSAVVRAIVDTKHLRAREPLLELVQALGRAYEGRTDLVYGKAYKELLTQHRISFPPPAKQEFIAPAAKVAKSAGRAQEVQDLHRSSTRRDSDFVDPFDPTGIYSPDEDAGNYETIRSAPRQSKSKAKKASVEEQLDNISSSLSLLNDILDNLGPGDKVGENELIQTILPSVERVHQVIMTTLQNDAGSLGETLTVRLFSANDAISECLAKYEKAKKGIFPNPKKKSPSDSPTPVAPPKPVTPIKKEEDSFDEFAILASRKRPGSSSLVQLNSASSVAAPLPNSPAANPFNNPFTTLTSPPGSASANPFLPSPASQPTSQIPLTLLQPTHAPSTLTPTILQPTYTPPYSGGDSLI